jgi:glycosyltransferase involved in cell wall biosynthesis
MKLGYLLSHYPTAGHTFMLREVTRLRTLGWDISVVAIHPPVAGARLSSAEAAEARRAFYVTRAGLRYVLLAHLAVLAKRPAAYVRTWITALRMADWHPGRALACTVYFVESVVVGHYLETRGVGHVHTHFSSTVGLLVHRLFPLSLSVTFHGPDEFENPSGFRLAQKVEASRFVVAISSYARSQLIRHAPGADAEAIEVVPLGVEPARVTPNAWRPAPSPFRLVSAGRLAAVKGHQVLLDALDEVRRVRPDVVLHLAGDGPERARLERHVRARRLDAHVVFEGLLDQTALEALYRRADAFVLASFAEGVPVVLMEAMALGIPCIATWVNGVPELIESGREGLLVAPGDRAALAAAMVELMTDADRRRRIGLAGRAKVLASYDIDINVRKLADVFERRLRPPQQLAGDPLPSGALRAQLTR